MAINDIDMLVIAKKANVSRQVVSYVLNNRWKEKRVSKDTRDRVLSIVKELDYQPNIIARGLVKRKTYNIGIGLYSIDYLTQLYFSTIISGIAHQVGLHNYKMQFTVTDETTGDSAKNLFFKKFVNEKSIDGLIIVDQCVSDENILWLKKKNIPFVLVDRFIPQERINCVRVDNEEGIKITTEHLLKMGHKRTAFISESLEFNKDSDMLKGYKRSLEEYNLAVDEDLFVYSELKCDLSLDNILSAINRLLGLSQPPTAIVCSADLIATKVLKILRSKHIRVPQDVALVGYNDDPNFAHVEPQLTTIHVPLREMGEESAKILFSLIDGQVPQQSEVVLESYLIVRQSSKKYTFCDEVVEKENITQAANMEKGTQNYRRSQN